MIRNKKIRIFWDWIASLFTIRLLSENFVNIDCVKNNSKKFTSLLKQFDFKLFDHYFPWILSKLDKLLVDTVIDWKIIWTDPCYITDENFYYQCNLYLKKFYLWFEWDSDINIYAWFNLESVNYKKIDSFTTDMYFYQVESVLENVKNVTFLTDNEQNVISLIIPQKNFCFIHFVCSQENFNDYIFRIWKSIERYFWNKLANNILDNLYSIPFWGSINYNRMWNNYFIWSSLSLIPPSFWSWNILAIMDSLYLNHHLLYWWDWHKYFLFRKSVYNFTKFYKNNDVLELYKNNYAFKCRRFLETKFVKNYKEVLNFLI